MRQFDVGQVVTCMVRHAAPGNYRIVGLMPDRDGDRTYRIKNPREEYERVVTETLLAKSEGCLPESESYLPEALTQRSRRKITLPTLQGARPAFLAEATS